MGGWVGGWRMEREGLCVLYRQLGGWVGGRRTGERTREARRLSSSFFRRRWASGRLSSPSSPSSPPPCPVASAAAALLAFLLLVAVGPARALQAEEEEAERVEVVEEEGAKTASAMVGWVGMWTAVSRMEREEEREGGSALGRAGRQYSNTSRLVSSAMLACLLLLLWDWGWGGVGGWVGGMEQKGGRFPSRPRPVGWAGRCHGHPMHGQGQRRTGGCYGHVVCVHVCVRVLEEGGWVGVSGRTTVDLVEGTRGDRRKQGQGRVGWGRPRGWGGELALGLRLCRDKGARNADQAHPASHMVKSPGPHKGCASK